MDQLFPSILNSVRLSPSRHYIRCRIANRLTRSVFQMVAGHLGSRGIHLSHYLLSMCAVTTLMQAVFASTISAKSS
jgi:hypothetical protein